MSRISGSDLAFIIIVAIAASCEVAERVVEAQGSTGCTKAGGEWQRSKACDPGYCEGVSK